MTTRLYKSRNKWKKASVEQRTNSSFQVKLNIANKTITKLYFDLKVSREQIKLLEKVIHFVVESGKVKVEEIKPLLKRRSQIRKELKNVN